MPRDKNAQKLWPPWPLTSMLILLSGSPSSPYFLKNQNDQHNKTEVTSLSQGSFLWKFSSTSTPDPPSWKRMFTDGWLFDSPSNFKAQCCRKSTGGVSCLNFDVALIALSLDNTLSLWDEVVILKIIVYNFFFKIGSVTRRNEFSWTFISALFCKVKMMNFFIHTIVKT